MIPDFRLIPESTASIDTRQRCGHPFGRIKRALPDFFGGFPTRAFQCECGDVVSELHYVAQRPQ
jgi:hypothetical protein